jgi:ubiquinone/menaquinone biosynthesis C-methylase UbiE
MEEFMTMAKSERAYIPAAGRDLFLPLYDFITKLMGADEARRALLAQANLEPGHRVLDIGCGTGTLVAELKREFPEVEVVGLDPDAKALARARRKANSAAVSIQFDQGFSHALPYSSASFDRVFSSFMLHHLPDDEKDETFREIVRVLKPGGRLLLLDFEAPESTKHRFLSRVLHSHAHLKGNSQSRILSRMKRAGFGYAKKTGERAVLFGLTRAGYYEASAVASRAQ